MLQLPQEVETALRRLQEAGYEAYIVGGCVRDRLLGRTPGDFDITTSALPEETEAVFAGEKVIETGLQHGTVTVLLSGQPLEITTYRIDGDYTDARHPDTVTFTRSLPEDLARRDFTINAMACDRAGTIVDPFGGKGDLEAKIIRCVGDPDTRFAEDALRILRALRFASVLDFTIDAATDTALRKKAYLLRGVSAERVREEMTKLLCGTAVHRILMAYPDVFAVVLPEIEPSVHFMQVHPCHIYTVYEHCAVAVENIDPEPVLRWTALLHDLGKPLIYTTEADGTMHFYGHANRSGELASAALTRLKFDTATRERILTLINIHDRRYPATVPVIKRALGRLTPEVFFQLLAMKRADNLAQAPHLRPRLADLENLRQMAQDIIAAGECFSLRDLAVSGDDLLALGMPKGPEIGQTLRRLLEAVIAEEVPNEKAALLALAKQGGS